MFSPASPVYFFFWTYQANDDCDEPWAITSVGERTKENTRLSPAGTNQRPLKSSQPIACSCLHFRLYFYRQRTSMLTVFMDLILYAHLQFYWTKQIQTWSRSLIVMRKLSQKRSWMKNSGSHLKVLLNETNTNVNECFSRAFSWTASPEEIMETRRHMEQIGRCRQGLQIRPVRLNRRPPVAVY